LLIANCQLLIGNAVDTLIENAASATAHGNRDGAITKSAIGNEHLAIQVYSSLPF
jgi:hypothetical protein